MSKHRIALISVYDKKGIEEFAKGLVSLGFKILASGGTARILLEAGIKVEDVAGFIGGGPILGHRVVTLSREVHAGLLAKDDEADRKELKELGIPFIDLVCADFYPLEEETNNPKASRESVIEKTDIGGPAMIRSGAKGRRVVICDFPDREKVLGWLKTGEPDRENFLNHLAAKAEALVSRYAGISAEYHSDGGYRNIFGKRMQELAYGENAHQSPAYLYRAHHGGSDPLAIVNWKLLAGSALSYNNVCDLDRMIQTMTHIGAGLEKNFGEIPYVAIGVKHGNACGASVAETGREAVAKMLLGDLRAIFGGSVMLNFSVDEKIAEELMQKYSPEGQKRLLDIVSAPSFTPEAAEILSRKKGKCRLLANPAIARAGIEYLDKPRRFRYVRGGFLEQPNYTFLPSIALAAEGVPREILQDVVLAWAIGSTSNSNTITLVKGGQLLGNGVGQQDRVGAAQLAIMRAGDKDLSGATAYSDSFFPFPDAPLVLIEKGIKTIFTTSGSVNDEKVIELCKQKGVRLIMLPDTKARGFYQH